MEIITPSLTGVKTIKGKDVKLKYIDCYVSFDSILLGTFDSIKVSVTKIGSRNTYKWEVTRGIVFQKELASITKSVLTMSNMPNHFSLEFTLQRFEYDDSFIGNRLESESLSLSMVNCGSNSCPFSTYHQTGKGIDVNKWDGYGEWLVGGDGKRWN